MNKQTVKDLCAIAAAITIMTVVAIAFPKHLGPLLRVGTGLVTAIAALAVYYVFRKSDVLAQLEDSLGRTAQYATNIKRDSGRIYYPEVSRGVLEIAEAIAQLAAKMMTDDRGLPANSIFVNRLERQAKAFDESLGELTGEVTLSPQKLRETMDGMLNHTIPETKTAIALMLESVEENRRNKIMSAQKELEIFNQLASTSTRAGDAAKMLMDILDNKKE